MRARVSLRRCTAADGCAPKSCSCARRTPVEAPLGERVEHTRQRSDGAPPGARCGVVVGVMEQQHGAIARHPR